MLSIIIPNYNSEKSLEKLLASIPRDKKIEIIVIDDNSNKNLDKLNSLINRYRDDNLKFLKNHSGKKGAGACRNIGIKEARGDWILFADSDDFFIEDFYSKIEKYFLTNNDIVFFQPISVEFESGIEWDRHILYKNLIDNYIKNEDKISELELRYKFSVPWSKLFRREFILNNKIVFEKVIAYNDLMFSAEAGNKMKKFQATSEIIYCVTRNKGSLTVNTCEEVFDSRVQAYIRYCDYLKSILPKDEIKYLQLRGTGMFKQMASSLGINVKTVDIDPDLNPDYVASVTDLPFSDNSFDVALAFQVLEHLSYEEFSVALQELKRITKDHIIISLPDAKTLWRYSFHIPKIGEKNIYIKKPIFKKPEHVFDGEHYWEISKKGYPLSRILNDFKACGLKLTKTYRVPENTYHRFFVLDI